MCYSWDEEFEKRAQADVAKEDSRKTAPAPHPENPVRSERLTFWTVRVGQRDRAAEEATADRTLEKV